MSLKAFHIFFISGSILLALVFGVWNLERESPFIGILSFAGAIGLSIYLYWVIKKWRNQP